VRGIISTRDHDVVLFFSCPCHATQDRKADGRFGDDITCAIARSSPTGSPHWLLYVSKLSGRRLRVLQKFALLALPLGMPSDTGRPSGRLRARDGAFRRRGPRVDRGSRNGLGSYCIVSTKTWSRTLMILRPGISSASILKSR
jgi:hypothetical protein